MPSYAVIENPNRKLSQNNALGQHADLWAALRTIEESDAEIILLFEPGLWHETLPALPEGYENFDLLHRGLCFGGPEAFNILWYISVNWLFLNPRPDRMSTSWKATPQWCMIRPHQVRALGGFDKVYVCAESSLMDFAYRLLISGGRVNHFPMPDLDNRNFNIPLVDEFLFILRQVNKRSAVYAAFWNALSSLQIWIGLNALITAFKRSKTTELPPSLPSNKLNSQLISHGNIQKVSGITAIIPTIDRYDYVQKSIDSLMDQNPPPDEIIVIDQTPEVSRKTDVYRNYDPKNVRIFFLNEAGQSSARNFGISKANNDWLLLFDDDAEAREYMIANHIKVIENSSAKVSAGIALAPWKDETYIHETNRKLKISSILDTGNCLVNKRIVELISCLDLAYNKGSGADHDLGLRLYLEGHEIIFNPKAIHTHYKAPTGGLRTHGVFWRNTVKWLGSYPQPTLIYTTQRFYPKKYWIAQHLLYYFNANKNKFSPELVWLWLSMPIRLTKAIIKAKDIHKRRSV